MVRIVDAESTCTSSCSFELKNLDRMTDFISDTESENFDWSSAVKMSDIVGAEVI